MLPGRTSSRATTGLLVVAAAYRRPMRSMRGEAVSSRVSSGLCPFMSAGLVPYSPHGEESRQSQKALENPEIQSAPARRAADRAGTGGTAQSSDQPRRERPWLRHRIAAAAG